MKKILRFISLVLSMVLLISFTSCSLAERFTGDMSQLEYDDDGNLIYNGNTYSPADNRFEVKNSQEDEVVELGWQSQFPFFPDMHYYAFEEETPLYIFCGNGKAGAYDKGLYVRSDYDLYSQLYVVDSYDIEISFESVMTPSHIETSKIDSQSSVYLNMSLKNDPRISVELSGPYQYDGNWYFIHMGDAWIINDEFISILIENDVIDE